MTAAAKAISQLVEHVIATTYGEPHTTGMRSAQWSALRYFADSEASLCTVGNFARHNLISVSSASQTISSLIKRRYLERVPSEKDGRSHQLRLTKSAYAVLADDPLNNLAAAVDALGARQRGELDDLLGKVFRRLRAAK